jgi:hypothetical protein
MLKQQHFLPGLCCVVILFRLKIYFLKSDVGIDLTGPFFFCVLGY